MQWIQVNLFLKHYWIVPNLCQTIWIHDDPLDTLCQSEIGQMANERD